MFSAIIGETDESPASPPPGVSGVLPVLQLRPPCQPPFGKPAMSGSSKDNLPAFGSLPVTSNMLVNHDESIQACLDGRRESSTTSDCKPQSASDGHGHTVTAQAHHSYSTVTAPSQHQWVASTNQHPMGMGTQSQHSHSTNQRPISTGTA